MKFISSRWTRSPCLGHDFCTRLRRMGTTVGEIGDRPDGKRPEVAEPFEEGSRVAQRTGGKNRRLLFFLRPAESEVHTQAIDRHRQADRKHRQASLRKPEEPVEGFAMLIGSCQLFGADE